MRDEPTLSLPWPEARPLEATFFQRDALRVAADLLGKVIRHRVDGLWLSAHIYMYYARGGDSLNFSAAGPGNAVLIKSAMVWPDAFCTAEAVARMQHNNPDRQGRPRSLQTLCSGQTLLCRALGLKVPDWDARSFDPQRLFVDDIGERPTAIIQTTRLGIPTGRDEHLPYRLIEAEYARHCTRNPLRRGQVAGRDYRWLDSIDSLEIAH